MGRNQMPILHLTKAGVTKNFEVLCMFISVSALENCTILNVKILSLALQTKRGKGIRACDNILCCKI